MRKLGADGTRAFSKTALALVVIFLARAQMSGSIAVFYGMIS